MWQREGAVVCGEEEGRLEGCGVQTEDVGEAGPSRRSCKRTRKGKEENK